MGWVTKRLPSVAVPVCWHTGFACQLGIKFLKYRSNLIWGVKQGFTYIQDHAGNRTRLIWVAARHLSQSVTWSRFLWLLVKRFGSWIWATKKPPGCSLAFGERSVTAVQSVVWLSGWVQSLEINWCGLCSLIFWVNLHRLKFVSWIRPAVCWCFSRRLNAPPRNLGRVAVRNLDSNSDWVSVGFESCCVALALRPDTNWFAQRLDRHAHDSIWGDYVLQTSVIFLRLKAEFWFSYSFLALGLVPWTQLWATSGTFMIKF